MSVSTRQDLISRCVEMQQKISQEQKELDVCFNRMIVTASKVKSLSTDKGLLFLTTISELEQFFLADKNEITELLACLPTDSTAPAEFTLIRSNAIELQKSTDASAL